MFRPAGPVLRVMAHSLIAKLHVLDIAIDKIVEIVSYLVLYAHDCRFGQAGFWKPERAVAVVSCRSIMQLYFIARLHIAA